MTDTFPDSRGEHDEVNVECADQIEVAYLTGRVHEIDMEDVKAFELEYFKE